jgi:hypothetical protein
MKFCALKHRFAVWQGYGLNDVHMCDCSQRSLVMRIAAIYDIHAGSTRFASKREWKLKPRDRLWVQNAVHAVRLAAEPVYSKVQNPGQLASQPW